MPDFTNIILICAAVTTALTAGLFFAWSCSVMPGFARLKDREFVAVMQACNRAIQNPVFFAAFFGAPFFLAIAAFQHYDSARFAYLLAAFLSYSVGVFGVTIAGNVPLNNALDRFKLETATDEETTRQRRNFERRWNNLNTIRTICSTLALILAVIACLK